jgi:viroplasmin and RNaseH domain-containing protein
MIFYEKVLIIYTNLNDVSLQVTRYAGNHHKGFKTREEAEATYSQFLAEQSVYYKPPKIAEYGVPKI